MLSYKTANNMNTIATGVNHIIAIVETFLQNNTSVPQDNTEIPTYVTLFANLSKELLSKIIDIRDNIENLDNAAYVFMERFSDIVYEMKDISDFILESDGYAYGNVAADYVSSLYTNLKKYLVELKQFNKKYVMASISDDVANQLNNYARKLEVSKQRLMELKNTHDLENADLDNESELDTLSNTIDAIVRITETDNSPIAMAAAELNDLFVKLDRTIFDYSNVSRDGKNRNSMIRELYNNVDFMIVGINDFIESMKVFGVNKQPALLSYQKDVPSSASPYSQYQLTKKEFDTAEAYTDAINNTVEDIQNIATRLDGKIDEFITNGELDTAAFYQMFDEYENLMEREYASRLDSGDDATLIKVCDKLMMPKPKVIYVGHYIALDEIDNVIHAFTQDFIDFEHTIKLVPQTEEEQNNQESGINAGIEVLKNHVKQINIFVEDAIAWADKWNELRNSIGITGETKSMKYVKVKKTTKHIKNIATFRVGDIVTTLMELRKYTELFLPKGTSGIIIEKYNDAYEVQFENPEKNIIISISSDDLDENFKVEGNSSSRNLSPQDYWNKYWDKWTLFESQKLTNVKALNESGWKTLDYFYGSLDEIKPEIESMLSEVEKLANQLQDDNPESDEIESQCDTVDERVDNYVSYFDSIMNARFRLDQPIGERSLTKFATDTGNEFLAKHVLDINSIMDYIKEITYSVGSVLNAIDGEETSRFNNIADNLFHSIDSTNSVMADVNKWINTWTEIKGGLIETKSIKSVKKMDVSDEEKELANEIVVMVQNVETPLKSLVNKGFKLLKQTPVDIEQLRGLIETYLDEIQQDVQVGESQEPILNNLAKKLGLEGIGLDNIDWWMYPGGTDHTLEYLINELERGYKYLGDKPDMIRFRISDIEKMLKNVLKELDKAVKFVTKWVETRDALIETKSIKLTPNTMKYMGLKLDVTTAAKSPKYLKQRTKADMTEVPAGIDKLIANLEGKQ